MSVDDSDQEYSNKGKISPSAHHKGDGLGVGMSSYDPQGKDRRETQRQPQRFAAGLLCSASDPVSFFKVFRDAVVAHRDMFLKYHVLHRGINIISVVYDSESSVQGGSCGGLIDIDLANDISNAHAPSPCHKGTSETRTTTQTMDRPHFFLTTQGTRAYQSVKVVKAQPDVLGPPDEMNNLESFAHALLHFLAAMDKSHHPNEDPPPLPEDFLGWDSPRAPSCFDAKRYLFEDLTNLPLDAWFNVDRNSEAVLLTLLRELQIFFAPRISAVKAALHRHEPVPFPGLTSSIFNRLKVAEGRCAAFIAIIDRTVLDFARESQPKPREDPPAPSFLYAEDYLRSTPTHHGPLSMPMTTHREKRPLTSTSLPGSSATPDVGERSSNVKRTRR